MRHVQYAIGILTIGDWFCTAFLLWCVLWSSHRNLECLDPFIDNFLLRLRYVIIASQFFFPRVDLKLMTSSFYDKKNVAPMVAFHLALPHSLRVLPHHLLLPPVQVKLDILLSLTSSYELRFECRSHHWNQDDEHFYPMLHLYSFYLFESWASLSFH